MRLGAEGTDPVVKAFPMENKKAKRPVGSFLLFLTGAGCLGAGVLLGPATGKVPSVESHLAKLTEIGLPPSLLMLGGAMLVGMAVVSRHMRVHTQTLLQRDQSERALTEMGADLAEFCNRLVEFQADHLHFRTELETMGKHMRAHHEGDRSGEAADGLFRLAASLDQLGARLDGKINESISIMGSNVNELGGLIAASRDFLQESVEENAEGIRSLHESMATTDTQLRELQMKSNVMMQSHTPPVQRLAQAPAPASSAVAATEVVSALENIEEDEVLTGPEPSEAGSSLGLLDSIGSPQLLDHVIDEEMEEEHPLALFEEAEERLPQAAASEMDEQDGGLGGNVLAGQSHQHEIQHEIQPEPVIEPVQPTPEPAQAAIPSVSAFHEPTVEAMTARPEPVEAQEAKASAPATVPLDAPAPEAAQEPASSPEPAPEAAQEAVAKAPAEETPQVIQLSTDPQAPLPAPQVPPALQGDAFTLAQQGKPGPMEIDLTAPAPKDEAPSNDPGFPPIGF